MSESAGSSTPGIKPLVGTEMVLGVLEAFFGEPVFNLEVVAGGNVAQTFSFTAGAEDYIVRFNAQMLVNFEKEAYVYENFASPRISIPRVVHVGRAGDLHFAITEKARGQNLLQLPRSDYLALLPHLIETLDAIHQVDVGERRGYGIFDGRGVAHASSWSEHLAAINSEEAEGDFWGKWHVLFRESFLERDVFDATYHRMMQLAGYAPDERSLVHGGYGFGNVLAQDGRITAVLDWMDARYGDFLYDVAWLDFFSPDDEFHRLFQEYYRAMGREVPHYSERLLCYECYIALDAMRFYARGNNKPNYEWARGRILSLQRRQ